MEHMKTYEAFDTDKKKMSFTRYEDIMNTSDRNRLNKILDSKPDKWSAEDKEFMQKMSYKDQTLYIGDDGKTYKSDDLKNMGYSSAEIDKSISRKPPRIDKDVKNLIDEYKKTLHLTKQMLDLYPEEYSLTTNIYGVYASLSKAIRELEV